MRMISTTKLIATVLVTIGFATTAKAEQVRLGADWVELDKGLWLGVHCQIADGSTREFIKSMGLPAKIITQLFLQKVLDKAVQKVTLAKGDAYCVYMHRMRPKGRNFDRRELAFGARRGDVPSIWHLAIYDKGQKKHSGYRSSRCFNPNDEDGAHSRCITSIVKGNDNTSGFAACFEPELPGNKKVSVVIRFGEVTGQPPTGGRPIKKDSSCDDRRPEYLDTSG